MLCQNESYKGITTINYVEIMDDEVKFKKHNLVYRVLTQAKRTFITD